MLPPNQETDSNKKSCANKEAKLNQGNDSNDTGSNPTVRANQDVEAISTALS